MGSDCPEGCPFDPFDPGKQVMAVACLCALDWFGDLWVTLGLLVVPLTTYICDIIYKLMTELTPELLEKNHDKILTLTGQDSFLNWNDFEASSRKVVEAVDALNKEISIFREAQQIYFIQNSNSHTTQ